MHILLHLYYISRGIFGHFCAFLGNNSAFRLFYILSKASEHFIYFYLFFWVGLGVGVGSLEEIYIFSRKF